MVPSKNPYERPSSVEFLETSEKIEQTYKTVLEAERKKSYDLSHFLDHTFSLHDRTSTDCHSFTAAILHFEYGLPIVMQPDFKKPKREDYEWETTWLGDLRKAMSEARSSPVYQQFSKEMAQFQENLYRNSTHFKLPTFNGLEDAEIEESEKFGAGLATHIANTLVDTKSARTLIISGSGTGSFVDLHMMTILGPTEDGTDVWVLDKEEIGSAVHVTKLSEIISSYTLNPFYKKYGMELSLCHKSASDVYLGN